MFDSNAAAGALVVALMTIVVAMPIAALARYLGVGWFLKRSDIVDGLSATSIRMYFRMFDKPIAAGMADDDGDALRTFSRMYAQGYGRRYFIVPSFLLFMTVLLGASLVTAIVLARLRLFGFDKELAALVPAGGGKGADAVAVAVSGLAGAYLWVVNDFISRARRLDFAPADVHWATLRLIIAVPMAYAFTALGGVGQFVAFALGAFPLTTLVSMMQRIASKALGQAQTPEESSDEVVKLQGINRAISERLANEDVTTIVQIAYCDPVRLAMRSNLTFNCVIDFMNQALAWLYFEDRLRGVLQPLGLRGAIEIRCLVDELDSPGETPAQQASHQYATGALGDVARALGQGSDTLQGVLRQIALDPFTEFIAATWSEVDACTALHRAGAEVVQPAGSRIAGLRAWLGGRLPGRPWRPRLSDAG